MLLVGLDPGGKDAFGWCVLEDGLSLPLKVLAANVADNVSAALAAVDHVVAGNTIAGVGIDAPLFWSPCGDRCVDEHVREAICKCGAHGATVNAVGSMRGACLVQGIMAGMKLRQSHPNVPLTEAHPKNILWMLGEATKARKVTSITLESLSKYFDTTPTTIPPDQDHTRDAALAALTAWAMVHQAAEWEDIRPRDQNAITPIVGPMTYWVPTQKAFAQVATRVAMVATER